jgi:hypothetical protein
MAKFRPRMVDYIHEGFFNRARIVLQKKLKITQPGLIWNPALWIGNYKIYLPSDLQSALQGLCLDYGVSELTETTDAVSRRNPPLSLRSELGSAHCRCSIIRKIR